MAEGIRTRQQFSDVAGNNCVSCEQCDRCTSGRSAKCRLLLKTGYEPLDGFWGLSRGYASHIQLLRGITLVSVPESISDAVAAPAACATATVMAVLEAAGDVAGQRVLVSGAGMLGIVACAVASHREAVSVEVSDLDPERLELAREFGATATRAADNPAVRLDPEHLVRSLLSITGVHNYEPRHLQQAMDFLAETDDTHD